MKTPRPLLYQKRWINDPAPIKVYEKSRRIGISWTAAYGAVLNAAPVAGTDSWYTGYNREMALEFIEDAGKWTRWLDAEAREREEIVVTDEDKDILAYKIRFASGHKIVALSSRPANLRGKQGTIVIDEAAFHDDLAGLLKAALAVSIWGGRVQIISTHHGADNPFAELVNDIRAGRKPYSLHRTSLDEALQQGLYKAICRETGTKWSLEAEAGWKASLLDIYGDDSDEELFCIPSQSGGVFLPSALIESRMRDDIPVLRARGKDAVDELEPHLMRELAKLHPHLETVLGFDYARTGDATVIWLLQIMQDLVRRTPFIVELREVPFAKQKEILFMICEKLPHFRAGAMDATGSGAPIAEDTGDRFGGPWRLNGKDMPGRIEPVNMDQRWYRDNMPRYKDAFERAQILIPKHHDVLQDHRLIRMERGIARIPDKRTRGSDGGQRHGDSAIAGALAYYASYSNYQEYGYDSASKTPEVPAYGERVRDLEDDYQGDRGWGSTSIRGRFGSGSW